MTVTHIGQPSPTRIAEAVLALLSTAAQPGEPFAIEERESPTDAEPNLPPAA